MCKSQLGTCYLQVTYSNADSMPTVVHGCADKLTERILRTCTGTTITDSDEKLKQNISDNTVEDNSSLYKVEITDSNVNNIVENSVDPSHDQTITCCSNDMCNYRDSLDISIVIDTQSNESAMKGTYLVLFSVAFTKCRKYSTPPLSKLLFFCCRLAFLFFLSGSFVCLLFLSFFLSFYWIKTFVSAINNMNFILV